MRKSNKFVDIVLTLILILLLCAVGFLGYAVYEEICGEGENFINDFIGEYVAPIIESSQIIKDDVESDKPIFGEEISSGKTENSYNNNLYNQLDNDAKKIYQELYNNKENLKTGTYTIKFGDAFKSTLSKEGGDEELKRQYQSAIEAFLYENPDVFYLKAKNMYITIEKITRITGTKYDVYISNGNTNSYLADGCLSKTDVDQKQAQIEQLRDKIVLKLNGRTDYEKIKAIHDYLVETIEYDKTLQGKNIYNIYGALIEKKCVCEGYAKAFQYLMNAVGINNVIVIGVGTNNEGESENHAWNYVELDEKWYAIDTTWDDPILLGGAVLTNQLKYKYFLKGSITMNENHKSSGRFTEEGQYFEYPTLSTQDYK